MNYHDTVHEAGADVTVVLGDSTLPRSVDCAAIRFPPTTS